VQNPNAPATQQLLKIGSLRDGRKRLAVARRTQQEQARALTVRACPRVEDVARHPKGQLSLEMKHVSSGSSNVELQGDLSA
jgi:hypothetical protein